MEKKLTIKEFVEYVSKISAVRSIRGVDYVGIHVSGYVCMGKRQSTGHTFTIYLGNLYLAYIQIEPDKWDTKTLKPYLDGVQSPSLAILKEVELMRCGNK